MQENCARCGPKVESEAAWHGSGATEGHEAASGSHGFEK
jgi:hypothetical protein